MDYVRFESVGMGESGQALTSRGVLKVEGRGQEGGGSLRNIYRG